MTYYGYPWSEAMCFGIGAGLGFYYSVKDDISPTRMIFVRGPEMEPTFFSIAAGPASWKHANNDTLETIKKCLDQDVPVIIQTDIYYLGYYNSSTHFPGHIVSVWGYDDESGDVRRRYAVRGSTFRPHADFSRGMGLKTRQPPTTIYGYRSEKSEAA
jgi:hypothetical protein